MTAVQAIRADCTRLTADIVGFDREERPVLVVEVKAGRSDIVRIKEQLVLNLEAVIPSVPFGMTVTDRTIQAFRWDGERLSDPVFESNTADILSVYDSEFSQKQVFEYYLIVLVDVWLHDVAYRWKSEVPPGYPQLEKAGIAHLLEGGSTRAESSFAP